MRDIISVVTDCETENPKQMIPVVANEQMKADEMSAYRVISNETKNNPEKKLQRQYVELKTETKGIEKSLTKERKDSWNRT